MRALVRSAAEVENMVLNSCQEQSPVCQRFSSATSYDEFCEIVRVQVEETAALGAGWSDEFCVKGMQK
ncbi:hypothetical protein NDU88_008508 [Pleurodeles waltl]|uniref:Uncharacterized protein n=1 Tax=Pleurodeles waltl TaxID=8319 RepID=A0AAV7QS00_PLEWA|nr:hypothetical protein NDU88_008508 [Pleurodeles waltl]